MFLIMRMSINLNSIPLLIMKKLKTNLSLTYFPNQTKKFNNFKLRNLCNSKVKTLNIKSLIILQTNPQMKISIMKRDLHWRLIKTLCLVVYFPRALILNYV